MDGIFSRTEMLLGREAVEKLARSRVAVFGIGGVGGYVVEALVRSGIGAIDVVDNDVIDVSNINRQIIATCENIGRNKVDEAEKRIRSINPDCIVRTYKTFFLPETASVFDFSDYDYVADAIDTVTGKLALIEKAIKAGVPVISSMGAGNKTDPTAFRVADIYDTRVCPLAKIMRRECRKRGIEKLKVVYSEEQPVRPVFSEKSAEEKENSARRRDVPGSLAFVPSVAGLVMAGEIIMDLIENKSSDTR